jgi:general stress protein 26
MAVPRSALRLTDEELEKVLQTERTCRIGTVSPDGEPHVAPLWFVWHDKAMWFNSLKRSRRSSDLAQGSRVSVCVDAGHEYAELHGAVLYGKLDEAGDVPEVRKMFGDKYFNGFEIPVVKSHRWLVLRPDKIVSWDFKKIPQGRDRRLEATQS